MSLKAERKEIILKGETFSYLSFDSKSPENPIIFLHATGLNASTYIDFLSNLFEKFNGNRSIHFLDQRGHGLSKAKADHKKLKSWETYAKDAISFIEELNIETCDLMGHSMGAIVAANISSKKKNIRNLIMIEPVLFYRPNEAFALKYKRFFKIGESSDISLSAAKRRNSFDSLENAIDHFTGRAIFKTWPKEALENYLQGGLKRAGEEMLLSCDPVWEAKTFNTVSYDTYKHLKRLNIPTYILRGSSGTSTFSDQAKEYLTNNDKLKIEEFSGSHFLPIENASIVSSKVSNFLDE
jgi:pimeloyl-ACP methyl ester carboxylesterase